MLKKSIGSLALSFIALAAVGCTPELEPTTEIEQTSNSEVLLEIPAGFDFKTHDILTIDINDNQGEALYEVYVESRIPDQSVPDSLKVSFDEIERNNIIYNYKFSALTKDGNLSQKIQIPTYASKVFVRRKGNNGFTDYLREIAGGRVSIEHSRTPNDFNVNKSNSVTNISSPLTEDVFVNGDARVNGGLNTNGFDLTVTGHLLINGSANLSSTTAIEANSIDMNGSVNLNGGLIYVDMIELSGSINGPGYIYYCTSYTQSGSINQNQADSIFQQQCANDSDGDGVSDVDDSFPNDSNKAFEIFSPSPTEYGMLIFEDLWPTYGDYDFNDVAVRYRTNIITNAQNEAVQIDFICGVKVTGAGYVNGFGIELEGVLPSQIQSVTGPNYTQGYIHTNSNGTESGQDNAVIIIADNVDNLRDEITVSVVLSNPVQTNNLGASPFNPFIIANSNREYEIHLPNMNKTTHGNSTPDILGTSMDPDGNYISEDGFSWAISVLEDIPVAKENVRIDEAYNYFATWATSGGNNKKNWYKELPGHRNKNKLRD